MLHTISVDQLSDKDLLDALHRAARDDRQRTAQFLALIGEVDARKLYLGQGCSSTFNYCLEVLHLSEHAAYHRIEAARAARRFPVILDLVAEGALTLTSVAMLRKHLTPENHVHLLEAARHKKKHEVERQVRALAPCPDERTILRKVPAPAAPEEPVEDLLTTVAPDEAIAASPNKEASVMSEPPAPRPTIARLSPERYLLKVTVSTETHNRLRRAQQLMRHTLPSGDPAAILDRALTLLVDHLERTRFARTPRPRLSDSRI